MADAATLTIDIREGAIPTQGPPPVPSVPIPAAPYQPLPHPNGTVPFPISGPTSPAPRAPAPPTTPPTAPLPGATTPPPGYVLPVRVTNWPPQTPPTSQGPTPPTGGSPAAPTPPAAAAQPSRVLPAAKTLAGTLPGQVGSSAQTVVAGAQKGVAAVEAASSIATVAGVEGMAEIAAVAWPVAAAIGAIGATAGLASYGLKKVADSAEEYSKRLTPYSAPLAQASAEAQISQVLNDLRRAQLIGTDLAKFTTAQSNLSQAWQDQVVNILQSFLPVINRIAEFLTKVLDEIPEGFWDLPAEILDFLVSLTHEVFFYGLELLKKIASVVTGIEDNIRPRDRGQVDLEQLWEALEGKNQPAGFGDLPPRRNPFGPGGMAQRGIGAGQQVGGGIVGALGGLGL